AETGREAEIVAVVWIVLRSQRSPYEIHRIEQPIQVVVPDVRSALLQRSGNQVTVAVITDSQVADEFAVDAPVVLHERPEVDHAPAAERRVKIHRNRARFVPLDIRQGLVGHGLAIRLRSSSRRHAENGTKLQGVCPANNCNLLLKRVAWNQ